MPPSLLEILRKTEAFFAKAGVEQPRIDAEWLIAHVLGCRRLDLYLQFDRPMAEEVLAKLRPLVARRARREPLQHVIGETPFAGLTLTTDRRALVPRPETEQLVEDLVAEAGETHPHRILDLGTGTGAIALALAQAFPEATVVAVDASPSALELARENEARNGLNGRVDWRRSDWFAEVEGAFDWIVSNPPYLTEAEWSEAQAEVRDYEPRGALVAAEEGTSDLRRIIAEAFDHLDPGGLLVCETGIAQHDLLREVAQARGFAEIESRRDFHDRPRYFRARRPTA